MQCILTTHSPYVLDELPPEGRIYLMESEGQKRIISQVSPAFAMTKMDDEIYPDADVCVEDDRSSTLLNEIISRSDQKDLIVRYQTIPFGAANVGRSLGTMVKERRFKRPSIVFLDGDQMASDGCVIFPGGDAPEIVIFDELVKKGVDGVAARIGRSASDVADTCSAASLVKDHHEWVKYAADRLAVSGDVLWQAVCAEWSEKCLPRHEANKIGDAILATIVQHGGSRHVEKAPIPTQTTLLSSLDPT
jgi:hypothetical protein